MQTPVTEMDNAFQMLIAWSNYFYRLGLISRFTSAHPICYWQLRIPALSPSLSPPAPLYTVWNCDRAR